MAAELVKVFDGVTIRARESDKFVNATALCKARGKRWAEYDRVPAHHEFREAVARKVGIPTFKMVEKRPGNGGGTWVHPEIAIHLCMWISPDFAAQVTGWIQALLTEGAVNIAPPVSHSGNLSAVDADDPLAGQIVALQQNLALMLETRRRQVAIERQQAELVRQQQETRALIIETKADAADTRALAVCANNAARAALDQSRNNHGMMQVLGYARLIGLELSEAQAAAHGRALSRLCRERGVQPCQDYHQRYGLVNLYPVSILEEHFANEDAS